MHSHHNNIENPTMDQCAYRSRLRCWNAEWKLLFMLSVILLNLLLNRVSVSVLTILFMGVLSVAGGRLPLRCYLRAIAVPLSFILLGAAAIGVEFGKTPKGLASLSLGFTFLFVTKQSLWQMFQVIAKALGAISAMYMVTLSTPAGEFVAALEKLHLPPLFLELMHLIYRYVFLMLEAQQNMRLAAESRLGNVDFKTSCRTFGSVMGNLFVVSLQKSRTCFAAMESRCYDAGGSFYQEEKPLGGKQAICMLLYFLSVAIVL